MIKRIITFMMIVSTLLIWNTSPASAGELTKGVNSYSNATIAQIQKVTAGTSLSGYEQVILDTEAKYDVNAIFILAVAQTETSMGLAGVGRKHKNNLFGITNGSGFATYSNPGESVEAFGALISNYYFSNGKYSLAEIGSKYCPATYSEWAKKVEQNINSIYQKMLA